jgi:hypothetical protein
MRCRDLKKRMIEADGRLDPDMVRHAEFCPTCSSLIAASEQLKRMLEAGSDEEQSALPYSDMRRQALLRSARATTMENIMASIRQHLQARPGMVAGIGLSLLTVMILAIVTLVPLPYTAVTGYRIVVTASDSAAALSSQQLSTAMKDSGLPGASVSAGDGSNTYIVCGAASEDQVRELANFIAEKTEANATATVEPITRVVSGTIYAQVSGKLDAQKQRRPAMKFKGGHLEVDTAVVDSLGFRLLSDTSVVASIEKIFRRLGMGDRTFGLAVKAQGNEKTPTIWLTADRDSTSSTPDTCKVVRLGLRMDDRDGKSGMSFLLSSDSVNFAIRTFPALHKKK